MRVPIVLSSRVREYFIIPGGIARVERGVPELETVFCPRHHSRLSEETRGHRTWRRSKRYSFAQMQRTALLQGESQARATSSDGFSNGLNVQVAAAREPPFFRHSRGSVYAVVSP